MATMEGTPCHDEYYSGRCVYSPAGCIGGCPAPCLDCASDCAYEIYQGCDGRSEGDSCNVPSCAWGCTTGYGVCRTLLYCEPNGYTNCLQCSPLDREPCDGGVPDVPHDDGLDADDALDDRGSDLDARFDTTDVGEDPSEDGGCACDVTGVSGIHGTLLVLWLATGLSALRSDRRRRG
jgi:hypothetical protein